MACRHRTVEGGDAGSMGVAVGVAELGRYTCFEALGDEVFQAFGFVVQLVDLVVEHPMQESLDEAMVANNLQCTAPARSGETDAAMALILDQRILRGSELLQHVGDGCRRHVEAVGQRGITHAVPLRAAQGKDGLQVIVDRLAALVDSGTWTVRHRAICGGMPIWVCRLCWPWPPSECRPNLFLWRLVAQDTP